MKTHDLYTDAGGRLLADGQKLSKDDVRVDSKSSHCGKTGRFRAILPARFHSRVLFTGADDGQGSQAQVVYA